MAVATIRLLLPTSIKAVPITTSLPFMLALPVRISPPISTDATSLMRIGTPPRVVTTTPSMSAASCSRPPARTTMPSPLRSMTLAPRLTLLASMPRVRSANDRPSPISRIGSGCTTYCLAKPPIESTPATPATPRICGLTIQSWTLRR